MLSDLAQYVLDDALTKYEARNSGHTGVTESLFEKAIAEIRQTCLQGPVRVVLMTVGDRRIHTIKVIRAYTALGLKEAKDVIDDCSPPAGSVNGRTTYADPTPILIPGEWRMDTANRFITELAQIGAKGKIDA